MLCHFCPATAIPRLGCSHTAPHGDRCLTSSRVRQAAAEVLLVRHAQGLLTAEWSDARVTAKATSGVCVSV